LPNAQLITIPDVGHYPSDEQTDEVVRIVNRFLAGERVAK
jgi:pimeloyl-ACP methyl ester carboxylesterase